MSKKGSKDNKQLNLQLYNIEDKMDIVDSKINKEKDSFKREKLERQYMELSFEYDKIKRLIEKQY